LSQQEKNLAQILQKDQNDAQAEFMQPMIDLSKQQLDAQKRNLKDNMRI